jgi:hypothetical protein
LEAGVEEAQAGQITKNALRNAARLPQLSATFVSSLSKSLFYISVLCFISSFASLDTVS